MHYTLNSYLPFANPAAVEVAKMSASTYELRMVWADGKFARSTDPLGKIWLVVNGTGGLAGGETRILKTSYANPSFIATAPWGGNVLSISMNGGASWRSETVANCGIRDIGISDNYVWLACGSTYQLRRLQIGTAP